MDVVGECFAAIRWGTPALHHGEACMSNGVTAVHVCQMAPRRSPAARAPFLHQEEHERVPDTERNTHDFPGREVTKYKYFMCTAASVDTSFHDITLVKIMYFLHGCYFCVYEIQILLKVIHFLL